MADKLLCALFTQNMIHSREIIRQFGLGVREPRSIRREEWALSIPFTGLSMHVDGG
jgi:hypothetical protein